MNEIERLQRQIDNLKAQLKDVYRFEIPKWEHLITPLTSTSWDGDAKTDVTSSTLLDLSAVFGAPAGIKAVLLQIVAQDSATLGTDGIYVSVGPSETYWYHLSCRPIGGSVQHEVVAPVTCDANGDLYYRINAGGTLNVWMRILGYWL